MVERCEAHLKNTIRSVMGENAPFFTQLKELKVCAESHVGSAIIDSDVIVFKGRPARNVTTRQEDIQLFDRTITFNVILGEYKLAALSPLFEAFLCSLGRGFTHEGHYIAITLGEAGWVAKSDSLIKAEIAVEIPVIFTGGVYLPQRFGQIKDIKIEREDSYGS